MRQLWLGTMLFLGNHLLRQMVILVFRVIVIVDFILPVNEKREVRPRWKRKLLLWYHTLLTMVFKQAITYLENKLAGGNRTKKKRSKLFQGLFWKKKKKKMNIICIVCIQAIEWCNKHKKFEGPNAGRL